MNIIYTCFGGAHSSVTAAAIHLGYLPHDRKPSYEEFCAIPFYDQMDGWQIGRWVFMGTDEFSNDIYICGVKKDEGLFASAIYSYLNASYIASDQVKIVNALVVLHPLTSIGGYMSRRMRLVNMGRPLTIKGIIKTYDYFVKLVDNVKSYERRMR